jgi:hypothetical protein
MEDGETVVFGFQDKYHARNGDNLLCPFQYDMYHFRNIKKWDIMREMEITCCVLLNMICIISETSRIGTQVMMTCWKIIYLEA